MVKINKNLILFILISFISISCNGEEYEKYLADHQLQEVAKIKLNNFTVHVAIDKSEYITGFNFADKSLDLSYMFIIIEDGGQLNSVIKADPHSSYQPVFNDGEVFLLATRLVNDSSGRSIIYYNKKVGLKEFWISYSKINQMIYSKGKIYTTWDKSIDYLRIIDVETGEIIIPKTDPLFYGDIFISDNRLYAVNYDYKKRKYTEIYEIKGSDVIPYKGKRFEIPKENQHSLDDYLINK